MHIDRVRTLLAAARPIQAGRILAAADGTFKVLLAPIDEPSDDHRVIVGELGWREPPLPFMASDSEQGHGDAVHVGNLTNFQTETVDGSQWVTADLTYDDDAEAAEFQRLATEGKFNGVSIHMGKVDFAPVRQVDGEWVKLTEEDFEELMDPPEGDKEAEGTEDVDPWALIFDGAFEAEIAAATQVAIPAFPGSKILAPVATSASNTTADTNGTVTMTPVEHDVIVAASLERPPAEWFTNPEFTRPTPLTVDDDGRVFGHLAVADTCHTGYQGQCVKPPDDPDFTAFLTARVIADSGDRVPVGVLVVDDGHAPASWTVEKTMRYYADTRLAAAYVNVGVDEHGTWVAGALAHNATDSQRETLRRHPLSGDWRDDGNGYKLIAAVSVNSPGFIVPEVLVASVDGEDRAVGLITFGPEPDGLSDLALVASGFDLLAAKIDRVLNDLAETNERDRLIADAEDMLADL